MTVVIAPTRGTDVSRFEPGHRVRVVAVTTCEGREPVTDPKHPSALDWNDETLIGKTGVVVDVFPNEFTNTNIRFEHLAELLAFAEHDLESDA